MLMLNETTLFYYQLCRRPDNLKPSGLIDNWVADVVVPGSKDQVKSKVKNSGAGNSARLSSTLVEVSLPCQDWLAKDAKKASRKSAKAKRSEPLPLITSSDIEWGRSTTPPRATAMAAVSRPSLCQF
jgi:hypothetical protein